MADNGEERSHPLVHAMEGVVFSVSAGVVLYLLVHRIMQIGKPNERFFSSCTTCEIVMLIVMLFGYCCLAISGWKEMHQTLKRHRQVVPIIPHHPES